MSADPESTPTTPHVRAPIQKGALGVSALFILIGVLGFIPGITQPYAELRFASTSGAQLFAIFRVSIVHNLVHLAFGIVGVVFATTPLRARNFLFVGGLVYLALALYGLVARRSDTANFIPINSADNFLHLVLAFAMIAMSILLNRGPGWSKTLRRTGAQV